MVLTRRNEVGEIGGVDGITVAVVGGAIDATARYAVVGWWRRRTVYF